MPKVLRQQRHTVLIVYEGYAEGHLLSHLRALYIARNAGPAVSTKNARGRGGRHVLDHALRLRHRAAYDEVAILIDTDQDWDDKQRRRARAHRVQTLESSPCLEAWLLDINARPVRGDGSQIKRDFKRAYGGHAHTPEVYPRHFPKSVLDRARWRVAVLDQILRLLGA